MALVLAYDEAKKTNQRTSEEDLASGRIGKMVQTRFFGSRDAPDAPYARLSQRYPGRVIGPHFHVNDQFQVIIDGKGKIGRHDLNPYCVHFTRAYTPYGPFRSASDTPLTYFVLRPRYDIGSQHLPKEREQLQQVPDRQPWQITCQLDFPVRRSAAAVPDVMLQAVPNIKDEQGLAAYTLHMKPNTMTNAPDPSKSDGQYVAVINGSLRHDHKEHGALTLVYVHPKENPFPVRAGNEGLEALIFNFPRPQPRTTGTNRNAPASQGLKTWQCELCEFVYDEALGMPEEGIAPGTRWEDVPETWSCPDCSATKADFRMKLI